jgi:uncharacterized protein YqeY
MLREKITEAMKNAMRAKDESVLGTIRMVNAAIKQKDIDVARPRGDERINDEEVLNLLQSLIKSRRESIALYEQGGRPELAAKEASEIAIIEGFLPAQMTPAEVAEAIDAVIAAEGAAGIKDMGRVMAAVKVQYAGRLDIAKASQIAKEKLGGSSAVTAKTEKASR